MKTYDRFGRLLGQTDTLTPIDVTAQTISTGAIPDSSGWGAPLAPITVNAFSASAAPAWYDSLLKPPTIYYVGAGLAFLAWLLNERPARR